MKSALTVIIVFLISFSGVDAQTINKDIKDGKSHFLLGKINKEGLTSEHYNAWFSKNFDDYNLDESVINSFAEDLKQYDIKLFMGTWCGDSKRQTPRFYKILEAANFPMNQLEAVAVSRKSGMYKKSPGHEEKGLNIHRVPTFIFYKNGKEVNRIIEKPVETLEKDIQAIVVSKSYKSNYHIVTKLHQAHQNSGIKGLKRTSKNIIKSNKNELKSMSELNTYAHILFNNNQVKEALAVLKLNEKLFPDNYRVYQNLGNKYAKMGKVKKALKYYKKAQNMEPDDKRLNASIAEINKI